LSFCRIRHLSIVAWENLIVRVATTPSRCVVTPGETLSRWNRGATLLMAGIMTVEHCGARSRPINQVRNRPEQVLNGSIPVIRGSAQFGKKL
jgi:hypothetical protein